MEMWKDVSGYEGKYEVSNIGNIRNTTTGKLLSQQTLPKGYKTVTLYAGKDAPRRTLIVHRIVAKAFIGIVDLQVNHKDGNKSNNCVENLEYCTGSENMYHAHKNNLVGSKRKSIVQINPLTGEVVKQWDSILDARMSGFLNVDRALKNKAKSCKGYYWRYVNA